MIPWVPVALLALTVCGVLYTKAFNRTERMLRKLPIVPGALPFIGHMGMIKVRWKRGKKAQPSRWANRARYFDQFVWISSRISTG
jgi:hypothetical protein